MIQNIQVTESYLHSFKLLDTFIQITRNTEMHRNLRCKATRTKDLEHITAKELIPTGPKKNETCSTRGIYCFIFCMGQNNYTCNMVTNSKQYNFISLCSPTVHHSVYVWNHFSNYISVSRTVIYEYQFWVIPFPKYLQNSETIKVIVSILPYKWY